MFWGRVAGYQNQDLESGPDNQPRSDSRGKRYTTGYCILREMKVMGVNMKKSKNLQGNAKCGLVRHRRLEFLRLGVRML